MESPNLMMLQVVSLSVSFFIFPCNKYNLGYNLPRDYLKDLAQNLYLIDSGYW